MAGDVGHREDDLHAGRPPRLLQGIRGLALHLRAQLRLLVDLLQLVSSEIIHNDNKPHVLMTF